MTVLESIDVEEAASMQPGQCSFRASAFSKKPRAKSPDPISAIPRDYGDSFCSKPPANYVTLSCCNIAALWELS
jgi:hypothetical protein